jgi:hypothetical protein
MSAPAHEPQPSLAQNCGAFVGHILRAIRTPVVPPSSATEPAIHAGADEPAMGDAHTVHAVMQERQVGDVTLRRIVIDQIVTAPQTHPPKSGAPDRNSP